jgi:DNA-binding GntR family transcriptional regulator
VAVPASPETATSKGVFGPYLERHPLVARGRTADGVAAILREAILDGVLEPGAWLREAELARELQVSRTPIRDAFRTLASEGFLITNANHGAAVAAMTSDDIIELYTLREALEGLAARLAARRASRPTLAELERLLSEMTRAGDESRWDDLAQLNLAFHKVIRAAASNRYLDRSLTDVDNAVRRFRHTTCELPGRVDESLAEHVQLAQAIAAGEPATAERVARGHMLRLAELRIRMLLEGH